MHSLACDSDALFRVALCALYCARPLVSCTPLAALVFGIMLCSRSAVHAACAECATLLRESALCGGAFAPVQVNLTVRTAQIGVRSAPPTTRAEQNRGAGG